MEQSILKSIKKGLNVAPDDDSFDLDIAMHVNSAFSTLHDLGVGPETGFTIEDAGEEEWDDFLPVADSADAQDPARVQQNQVKSFVIQTVRLVFDPPQSSYLLESTQRQLAELTSRISMRRENEEWQEPVEVVLDVIDGGDAG